MPLGWVQAGIGAANLLFGGGGGGGGSSGSPQMNAQQLEALQKQMDIANTVSGQAQPAYLQALLNQQKMNYQPIATGGAQAGAQYGDMARQAAGQATNLYGAGNQLYQSAFDPQNALYARTAQQLSDQINAGQAQRGLGLSPVGGSEYNQAMQNFNIDWQNQQLARQAQGVGAMNAAAIGAGQQGVNAANWLQTAQTLPITAQQQVYNMPADLANQYAQNMGNISNLYGNAATGAGNYQAQAIPASEWNTQFQAGQNAANANLLYQGLNTAFGYTPRSSSGSDFNLYGSPSSGSPYSGGYQSTIPGYGGAW